MSKKLVAIRAWLNRNKIFFELVVALSLTCMSVIVSVNANHIAEYQNELIKEENQPIFVFNLTHADNSSLDVGERIDIELVSKSRLFTFLTKNRYPI